MRQVGTPGRNPASAILGRTETIYVELVSRRSDRPSSCGALGTAAVGASRIET
jgi:hypothetical protein